MAGPVRENGVHVQRGQRVFSLLPLSSMCSICFSFFVFTCLFCNVVARYLDANELLEKIEI